MSELLDFQDAFVAALKTYGLAEVGHADANRVELVRPPA